MVNRSNYLWTKQFLEYLENVTGLSKITTSRYWCYLRHLLLWADETPLTNAMDITPTFLVYVKSLPGKDGDDNLKIATQKKIIQTARRFFEWAKIHLADKFKITSVAWIDTLQMRGISRGKEGHEYVTVEEVFQLAHLNITENNLALQRDRAAAVMLFLSGMRVSAFASAPLEAFDLENCCIYQWPRELGVRTKNAKRATTFLLPIPELLEVVQQWDTLVRQSLPLTTPWYVPITNSWGDHEFSNQSPGKNRGTALNKRLRILFQKAKLPYKSAHKFRHGHAVYGLQHARTIADYKAVSMNLMHEDIRVTDSIYARLITEEVKTRISGLASQISNTNDNPVNSYLRNLSDHELAVAVQIASERLSG